MIWYQATEGQFNAKCQSQFIAMDRENFPRTPNPKEDLLKAKPCLIPVVPAGTATVDTPYRMAFQAVINQFDARCSSPFAVVDGSRFLDPKSISPFVCLVPVKPAGTGG